jgi:hypothetical protein
MGVDNTRDTGGSVGADLRFCGICWHGKTGVEHRCGLSMGHKEDYHECHCGKRRPGLKQPEKKD